MTPCLEPSLPSTKMAAAATLDVTDTDKALLRPRVKSFTPAHIALFGALVLFSFVAPAIVVFYSKEEAPTTIHAASGSGAEAQLATRQDWIIVEPDIASALLRQTSKKVEQKDSLSRGPMHIWAGLWLVNKIVYTVWVKIQLLRKS